MHQILQGVKVNLVKLEEFISDKVHFYSVRVDDDELSLFEQFVAENITIHRKEVMDILMRLEAMGSTHGARENYFKLNEGKPGDGVAALYDSPNKNLRLYCIRYGSQTVILGNGGLKKKNIRAYQDDITLEKKVECMINISRLIRECMKDKDFIINNDGTIACKVTMEDYEHE